VDAGSDEDARLRTRLAEAAEEHAGDVRGELLRAVLETRAGHDVQAVAARLASLRPDPFQPREHWFLADLLPPGAARVRSILTALEAATPPSRWQLLLAWNTAVDEARALRHRSRSSCTSVTRRRGARSIWP
jgi:hypothetical protein